MRVVASLMLIGTAGAGAMLVGGSVEAQPPQFKTTFRFEVKFSDGTHTYNENQQMVVNVWLPPDQPWQCVRNSPLLVDGRIRSGFTCTNDGWKSDVLTMVGCRQGAEDSVRTAAMRIYAPRADGRPQGEPVDGGADGGGGNPSFGKWIDLAVTCETVKVP